MAAISLPVMGPLAKKRLEELRIAKAREKAGELKPMVESAVDLGPASLDLMDFIPAVSPRWERPSHLEEIADIFRRIDRSEAVREGFSTPPQHGKSELVLHGIAWLLRRHPTWPLSYVAFGQDLSLAKSRFARDYAINAGVKLRDDSQAVSRWTTREGGGLVATSITGGLTGDPSMAVFLDDPYKNRDQANSEAYRDKVSGWLTSVAEARTHPGASIVVSHTRWLDDDLIGTLDRVFDDKGRKVWTIHNLPAINAKGEPLWYKRPLDFLAKKKAANEYDWWSLWMGNPRPRGGGLFRDVTYFSELPKTFRVGKGLDCAYTAKTSADASASVVMLQSGELYYVVDVRVAQVELNDFFPKLRDQSRAFPGTYRFRTSTTEKGIAQFSKLLPEGDVRIDAKQALSDKFTAAQPLATKWKNHKIVVPDRKACEQLEAEYGLDTSWVPDYLKRMHAFTGVGDKRDDEVDASINAFDVFPRESSGGAGRGGVGSGESVEDRQVGI